MINQTKDVELEDRHHVTLDCGCYFLSEGAKLLDYIFCDDHKGDDDHTPTLLLELQEENQN